MTDHIWFLVAKAGDILLLGPGSEREQRDAAFQILGCHPKRVDYVRGIAGDRVVFGAAGM